jgi:hypothetical protein
MSAPNSGLRASGPSIGLEPALRPSPWPTPIWTSDVALLVYLGLATLAVHLATGGRYGFPPR